MSLADTFLSIEAAVVKFIAATTSDPPGQYSHVLGTGFVVDASGIVATNRHIVDAFRAYGPRVRAVFSVHAGEGSQTMIRHSVVEIVDVDSRVLPTPNGRDGFIWYGQDPPDLALIQVRLKGLPAVALANDKDTSLRPGVAIATAGYPLGQRGLHLLGKWNQHMPFLRAGIISSVFPMTGTPKPHGFTIDILQQGGSSGSPIFLAGHPLVVGMMSSSVIEPENVSGDSFDIQIRHNTNISICEPAWLLSQA